MTTFSMYSASIPVFKQILNSLLAILDKASAIDLGFPHEMMRREMPRTVVFGNAKIEGVTV